MAGYVENKDAKKAHGVRTFEPALLLDALWVSLKRLTPTAQWRNPVMFVTWIGALLTTVVAINDRDGFTAAIAAWLWLTVLFANFAKRWLKDAARRRPRACAAQRKIRPRSS